MRMPENQGQQEKINQVNLILKQHQINLIIVDGKTIASKKTLKCPSLFAFGRAGRAVSQILK